MKKNVVSALLPFITLAACVLLWSFAAKIVGTEYILPSVSQTLSALFKLLKGGEFYRSFALTFLRTLVAFSISFSLGFLLAFIKSRAPLSGGVIEPIVSVLRALPTIAIILLLLLWTNSRVAPVVVTLLVVLPTSYAHLLSAFESIDKTSVEAGRVDGAGGKQTFAFIEFPQIAPAFFKAAGGGLSLNFKLMVAAEVLAQTANSIGYMLNTAKAYFEIAQMTALVLFSVVACVIIERAFNYIAEKVGEWR